VPAKRSGWPPRWLTRTTPAERRRGDGATASEFVNQLCRITKDTVAGQVGEPIVLREWQANVLAALLARRADGRLRHRQALIGMPRKNGKSALASALGLYWLLLGPQGGEVYSCAAEKEQARIVFGMAKRMVELEPELEELVTPYRDVLEVKSTGSIYRVLSAESYSKEGLNPSAVIFDEVHAQPNRELWDVMQLASGARVDPVLLGITTAGVMNDSSGRDSLCYTLYKYGQDVAAGHVVDPSFFFAWWEPKAGLRADHTNPKTWREANPGFGDIVSAEDFAATLPRTPENEYRTKRLNVFTADEVAWLPFGAWEKCTRPGPVDGFVPVVLGFDGSFNNDSTALVVASVGEIPHVDVVAVWEKTTDDAWRVPILDVEATIRDACRRYDVREIVCDPFRWARTYQVLESEGFPVVEYPQSPARMVPATQRFYESVMNRTLTHSGHAALARHVGNAVVKTDARGSRLEKPRGGRRKIDLAVAAVMAVDRAAVLAREPELVEADFYMV
jgi:phage terminase large subunit-like protein